MVYGCATIPPENVKPFESYSEWLLIEDLPYAIRDTNKEITIPKGFVTDYASIPRAFCMLLPQQGRYSRSAIIHDYLYWKQECSRKQSDRLMFVAMTESGVDSDTRDKIYKAIRLFGQTAWDSNEKERKEEMPRIVPPKFLEIPGNQSWTQYREYLNAEGVQLDPKESTPPFYCEERGQVFPFAFCRS